MREIKFRAWETIDGVMWEWPAVIQFGFKILTDPTHITMQYTGLKDKNGKEIYEGDIVSFKVGKGMVAWDDGSAGFVVENELMAVVYFKETEVIGNIYENPELVPK